MADMIKVDMSDDKAFDMINGKINLKIPVFIPLKKAAIDQYARIFCHTKLMAGARYARCRTMKSNMGKIRHKNSG